MNGVLSPKLLKDHLLGMTESAKLMQECVKSGDYELARLALDLVEIDLNVLEGQPIPEKFRHYVVSIRRKLELDKIILSSYE